MSDPPEKRRAELAYLIIPPLSHDANESIETAWEAELLKRAQEIENGRAIGEPAQKVFSDLRAKYSRKQESSIA